MGTDVAREGVEVLGVRAGYVSRAMWALSRSTILPFQLIADTDNRVALVYGTWGGKTRAGKAYMGMTRKSFFDRRGWQDRTYF